MTRDGTDLTEAFERGVRQVLRVAVLSRAGAAVLQPRSPSCGRGVIYDGTFTSQRVPGNGMLAQALMDAGMLVLAPDELD